MQTIRLNAHGITVPTVLHNPSVPTLYEAALRNDRGTYLAETGAMIAYSGAKTGRSPKDKHVVKSPQSEADIWWGPVNIAIDAATFRANHERAVDYLNSRERLYCVDAFAGWDPNYRIKVRTICARPYHALFMYTMLIRPTEAELTAFGQPDYTIYNAGTFPAHSAKSDTSIDLNFETGELVILGTEYAGEMKKGVFTIMNYLMPKRGVLSMHCSATEDPQTGRSSVLFGLSGTGKTTLSADPNRRLIGDDEHCWSDEGIFNIEGGCYAKAIDLSPESEPDIYQALRYGAVLENVTFDEHSRRVNFGDRSVTENTRGAYPIEYIHNAKIPCMSGHPTDIIFLTCDAFGVLPPVSKLTPEQAMYQFISGYTAKVAGTEVGVTEPTATFSACFGAPFLVWHPGKYAHMLADKIRQHNANVWLVNTGWSGGAYGTGKRMKLAFTRAIIDAIDTGELASAPTEKDPLFGLNVVTKCSHVPTEILIPRNTWQDKDAFDKTARKLAGLFVENFKQYADGVSDAVRAAGPAM